MKFISKQILRETIDRTLMGSLYLASAIIRSCGNQLYHYSQSHTCNSVNPAHQGLNFSSEWLCWCFSLCLHLQQSLRSGPCAAWWDRGSSPALHELWNEKHSKQWSLVPRLLCWCQQGSFHVWNSGCKYKTLGTCASLVSWCHTVPHGHHSPLGDF